MSDPPSPTPTVIPGAGDAAQAIARLQNVMDQAPVAMALFVGDEVRVAALNQQMGEILDTSLEAARGRPLLAILPELRGQGFDDLIRGVLTTGVPYVGRETYVELLRGGGLEGFYYNFVYSQYHDEDGGVIGVLDVATDVTDLVRARQLMQRRRDELREDKEELERLVATRTAELAAATARAEAHLAEILHTFDQAPVIIYVLRGRDHVFTFANDEMCTVVERPIDDILGRPFLDVFPELRAQGFAEVLEAVMTTGEPALFNNRPVKFMRDGREDTGYFNFSYQAYRDGDDRIAGVTCVGTEVTEQHLANEKLAASERESRTILESLPNMSWTHLPDGRRSFVSQRWADYSGVPIPELGDIESYDWSTLVHPDDLDAGLALYRQSLASGRQFTHEQRIRRADGAYRWHLNRAVPLRDDGGAIRLWVGTATDIHELRDAETKLLQLSAEVQDTNEVLNARNQELALTNLALTRSNADMDNFVYTASHDLKAPITNIQGLHAMLREELLGRDAGVEPILDMVDKSLERFMRTIKDLADVARLHKREETAEVSLLEEVLADVLLDCESELAESGGEIVVDLGEDCAISVSHKNLRSVVYNLVSNAIKYRSSERPLEVRIACVPDDGFDVLSVTDNGLGMNLGRDHKLFSMFYRMHDHVEGSGVGLHIAKKIMDNLNGRLEVESEPNVGTTFRAYFKTVPS